MPCADGQLLSRVFLGFLLSLTTINRTYYPFELKAYEYLWHEATLDSGCSTWAI